MQYKLDIPYPEIKVSKKDINLAKSLFNLYAGSVSEDTCIHQYIFEMLIFQDDKEIKDIFKGIAVVEMHHLEILGTLIKKLGFTPIFVGINNNKTKWFSGEYINYHKDLKGLLLYNINQEKIAIKSYEEVINKTSDENVIHILKRIILDEKLHVEIFSKLYNLLK